MRFRTLGARALRALSLLPILLPILPVVLAIWAIAVLALLVVAVVALTAGAGAALVLISRAVYGAWRSRRGRHDCTSSTFFRGYCRMCGSKMEDLS